MARPLPWLFSYVADSQRRLDREVLRPVVAVSIAGSELSIAPRLGLVDTGSESVLAASSLAELAGIDLAENVNKTVIGIGGRIVEVTFAEVELRLHHEIDERDLVAWRTDIGFVPRWQPPFAMVLGRTGFLDQFTVTFHRGAATLAVEGWDAFDSRFGSGRST